jgi:hypothetical protein
LDQAGRVQLGAMPGRPHSWRGRYRPAVCAPYWRLS